MTHQSKTSKADLAQRAWSAMAELVLDNDRRREVSDALGLTFGQIRAVRRIARSSMTMGELAVALGVDAPYVTLIVDALEREGLVERLPHPTDRRVKIVTVTARGTSVAERAEEILDRPPVSLAALSAAELEALARILEAATLTEG